MSQAPASDESTPATVPVVEKLETFFFPNIANGISVKARNRQEAEELALKLA